MLNGMYFVLCVGVHCDHFCHSYLLYRTAYRCIVGAEVYPVSPAYKYNMREIAAYFVVDQVEYPLAGVGEEAAYQHRRADPDILPEIGAVVVIALPDYAPTVPVVLKLQINRAMEPVFKPRPHAGGKSADNLAGAFHYEKMVTGREERRIVTYVVFG